MVTIEEEVRLILVGNSLRVAIPSSIVKALKLERGQSLQVKTTDHSILLTPIGGRMESRKKG